MATLDNGRRLIIILGAEPGFKLPQIGAAAVGAGGVVGSGHFFDSCLARLDPGNRRRLA